MADPSTNRQSTTDKLWTPANVVTLIRICLVPVFVVALLSPWPLYFGLDEQFALKSWVAAGVFIVLAATDGVDGYLARSRGEITDFGKFMDPLADKILVAAALLSLIELGVLPSWPALIILTREFIVSGIRMVAASKGAVIAASWYGKAKTVTQIIAIVLFIVKDSVVSIDPLQALYSPLYLLSWLVMIAALVLTIISMLDYFAKARHLLGFAGKNGPAEPDAEPLPPAPTDEDLAAKAEQVIKLAAQKHASIGCAESLTGGMISGFLTSVPGSSSVVRGCVVSYVNDVKHRSLGVPEETLASQGAVSSDTACSMAQGALAALDAQVSVAVTGIAGPGGAEPGKPVGTVWIGRCRAGEEPRAQRFAFAGDRDAVRRQTVDAAFDALLSLLAAESQWP